MSTELIDIRDIPYFAYSPGLWEWITFAVFAAVSIISIRLFALWKRKSKFKIIDNSLYEIRKLQERLNQGGDPKSSVFSASILARRMASYIEKEDISILSESELRKKRELSNSDLKNLLTPLIEIEKQKYTPVLESAEADNLLKSLIASIDGYKSSVDLRSRK